MSADPSLHECILLVLLRAKKNGERGLTRDEIQSKAELSEVNTNQQLRYLQNDGWVQGPGDGGTYSLTEEGGEIARVTLETWPQWE